MYKIEEKELIREVLINGKKVLYDAMSSSGFGDAVSFYDLRLWIYLGASNTYYINGIQQNITGEELFFFARK